MPPHDVHDSFDIRRTAGVHDIANLAKILGPKEPRRDHAELARILRVEICEVMHVTARNEADIAGPDSHLPAIDGPGQSSSEPIDGLVERFMAVRYWNASLCRDEKVEHRQTPTGFRSMKQESDLD